MSFIAFDREAKAGVVLLLNRGGLMANDASLADFGTGILRLARRVSFS